MRCEVILRLIQPLKSDTIVPNGVMPFARKSVITFVILLCLLIFFVVRYGDEVYTRVCCCCAGVTLVVLRGPPALHWVWAGKVLHCCALKDGTTSDSKKKNFEKSVFLE